MSLVSDVMTRGARTLELKASVVEAAQAMDELDIGALPVFDGDRLVGMLTDRDIVVRGVAQGIDLAQARLMDVMSAHVRCCYEDEEVAVVAARMAQTQIRRLPVLDRNDRLVGILSLGDVAVKGSRHQAGEALADISEPARPDRSGQSSASGSAGGGEQ